MPNLSSVISIREPLSVVAGRFSEDLPELFAQIVTVAKTAVQSDLPQIIVRIFHHLQCLLKPEQSDVAAAAVPGHLPEPPGEVAPGHIGGAGEAVQSQCRSIFAGDPV